MLIGEVFPSMYGGRVGWLKKRMYFMMGFFLFIFSLLLLRLFYYQIVKGEDLSQRVVSMHSQAIALREFPRGEILDRHRRVLTENSGSYSLYCRPQAISLKQGSRATGCRALAAFVASRLGNCDEDEIFELLIKASSKGSLLLKLHADLSPAEIKLLQAVPHPALEIVPQMKRYRQDGFMAHLIGYVSASGDDGQAGLEKDYNQLLQKGGPRQEVLAIQDARGQAIPGINLKVRTEDGEKNALVLTIDTRVQELVESTMNKSIAKGAVVVMDVQSKEILAMASRPTYNQYRVNEYLYDLESPLINRALSSYYPGSLFKIVVSTGILEENLVTEGEKFNCTGKYVFNDQLAISCWKKEGHGELSFEQAFANSCNPTFIRLGLRLGRSRLLQYVDALHVNDKQVIGMKGQQKDSLVEIDSGEPALGNACLGQRGVMLTPLQIASLLSTVADDGYWSSPSIVKYTLDDQGQPVYLAKEQRERVMSEKTAHKVQAMMEKVVTEGTGKSASLPNIRIAGKTATSQTGKMKDNGEEVLNTWFAGYLPADNPRWVIVVLAEAGRSGAENCAPVFKDIAQGMLAITP
jgi:penicillin-binding protein 2